MSDSTTLVMLLVCCLSTACCHQGRSESYRVCKYTPCIHQPSHMLHLMLQVLLPVARPLPTLSRSRIAATPCCCMPTLYCSYEQLREITRGRTVVVLPAFETAPQQNMTLAHDLADTAAMMTKEQLGKLVQRRLIYQFALYLFRQVGCARDCWQQRQH